MKPESFELRFASLVSRSLITVLFCGGTLLYAQRRSSPVQNPVIPEPAQTQPTQLTTEQLSAMYGSDGKPVATNEYKCFLPPLNSMQAATVGIADLQVPEKTHQEYEDACASVQSKKLGEAERHLRKAIKQYAKYSAAWVLLGQILEAQFKTDEAREACSKPFTVSASYAPAYLCLTDISARARKWEDVLTYSGRVLELDPTSNAAAYAYNATANLNLRRFPEAEKSALKAAQIDNSHSEPRVYFLLAQIYAAMGNRLNEIAELHEYLKYARDPDDVAVVKGQLAKLDGPVAK